MKEFETLDDLTASTQTISGTRLTVRDQSDTEYVLTDAGYAAAENDVTLQNGRVAARVTDMTTADIINSRRAYRVGAVIRTIGFYNAENGGSALWKRVAGTGTPFSTPAETGGAFIYDGLGQRWDLVVNGDISVRDIGAPTGGSDDSQVINAAISSASSKGVNVKIPSGIYNIPPPSSESTAAINFPEDPNFSMDIYGEGDSTVFNVSDNTSHGFGFCAVFGNPEGVAAGELTGGTRGRFGSVKFRDFRVEGAWLPSSGDKFGYNLFGFSGFKKFSVKRVTVNNWQSKFCRVRLCDSYIAMFNDVNICASDVFRAQETSNCVVSFNKVKHADDDAVALHSSTEASTSEPSRSKIIVEGNIIEDSEGILALGGKLIHIKNNILSRTHGTCLAVTSLGDFPEGRTAMVGVNITGNVITDPLTRRDNNTGTLTATVESQAAIVFGRSLISPNEFGGLVARPSATGVFSKPYGTDSQTVGYSYSDDFEIQGSAPANDVIISGNSITRTLPNVSSYSAWGYGLYVDRFGESDPPVSDGNFLYSGILLISDIQNCSVSGNSISGMFNSGIRFSRSGSRIASDNDRDFDNVIVTGNTISDVFHGISNSESESASKVNWGVSISGNYIDVDPYHSLAGRNTDGSWSDLTSGIDSSPTGILIRNMKGVECSNNTLKNCFRPIFAGQTQNVSPDTGYAGSGNVVYCEPVDKNYSPSNKGVAVPGSGGEYLHMVYDADPTSAGYGDISTQPNSTENQVPNSGTFVQGLYVKNGNPVLVTSPNRYIKGWIRVTTGSSNVTGTDWIEDAILI